MTSPRLPVTGHLALARQHDRFDGQQLAANFRPGQTGHDTNLIVFIDLAEAVLRAHRHNVAGSRVTSTSLLSSFMMSLIPYGPDSRFHAQDSERRLRGVIANEVTQSHHRRSTIPFLQTVVTHLLC